MVLKNFKMTILLAFGLASCTPSSHEKFVAKADKIYLSMTEILEKVEDSGDLYKIEELKPLYLDVAQLVLLSFKQERKNSNFFALEIIQAPHQENLRCELIRVYQLEGGQQACQQAARDALLLLQKLRLKK